MDLIKLTTDNLFNIEQIKLTELSVFNWGSFNGLHTAAISPSGTLITGDNGAGKSTLVDGLMALLLPAGRAAFNMAAAQGGRADRTLLSYMRGSFGSAHDGLATRVRSKREKSVISGLRAFYSSADGTMVTLAGLFWINTASNSLSDVKRIYIVARRNLQLKELLDNFIDGNARKLKQWLRKDQLITDCDSNFSDYQELYRKHLYMDNKNAPALLSRALGLKRIDDLTRLIRELVLEPSNVREDAQKIVAEFSDLVAIHDNLLDTKEQFNHLNRLPELANTIDKTGQQLSSLTREKNSLQTYYAKALFVLWQEKHNLINKQLDKIKLDIKNIEIDINDIEVDLEQKHAQYLNLGGDKIESLKKDLLYVRDKLSLVSQNVNDYQDICQKLSLPTQLSEHVFLKNSGLVADELAKTIVNNKQHQDNFAQAAAIFANSQKQLDLINNEITAIKSRPDSNMDIRYQQLRDEIADSLHLDSKNLVFIGELIDVAKDQKHWQGAIERALGGLRTTLLVSEKHYSLITRWLNARHTGLHVRVQVVLNNNQSWSDKVFDDGFLSKLIWKEHVYQTWLKVFLARFDLHCVADTDELDTTNFSMTAAGLIHYDRGRFEKKDATRIEDRRNWFLGFSNKDRLIDLQAEKNAAEQNLKIAEERAINSRASMDTATKQVQLWEKLKNYTWDQVNMPYWQGRLDTLAKDLQNLQNTKGNLQMAKASWDQAKINLQKTQQQKNRLLERKGSSERDSNNAKDEIAKYRLAAAPELSEEINKLLSQRIGQISLQNAYLQDNYGKEIDAQLEKVRVAKSHAENIANGVMASFRGKDKWQHLTVEWLSGLDGLADYLGYYRFIETEGLPQLVERFKERLNKHATQSIARIKTRLDSEREDILERIDIINQVLKRTEFGRGSYLRLGFKREKFPHVIDFEQKIKSVLEKVVSDDHESRFNILSSVVNILSRASAVETYNNLESLRLLDPRYQISFYAEEIDATSMAVKDVLESSSGKSGGEKESFAGTIVAASLAYVLTPEGHNKPVYCTVFLDEAFSNTAEAVSRRVLKVFQELHIHVNLITPYKNLNLARESASSLLIAERDTNTHESHLCEISWQEIDKRMAEFKQHNLSKNLAKNGVELNEPK